MNKEQIKLLQNRGILSYLDIQFARFVTGLTQKDDPDLFLASALLSSYRGQGHVCLDLARLGGRPIFEEDDGMESIMCPDTEAWKKGLEQSPVVGRPGEFKPMIMDDGPRLYLHRYWEYQERLASSLKRRVRAEDMDIDRPILLDTLARLFPEADENDADLQKIAAMTALKKKFCVISGGPGTGKTTTVAKIIALILAQAGTKNVRIALAAPTGKAAARLQAALQEAREGLECPSHIKERIPRTATTIHRLLGTIAASPYFRHNAQNPLPVDMVVVDEASMVDMALMSKMIQAIPHDARLILLGDKDQLASVEAGAVLGDICEVKKGTETSDDSPKGLKSSNEDMDDCIVVLQKSYRFGGQSGIRAVSRTVNAGNGRFALQLIHNHSYADIKWMSLPRPEDLPKATMGSIISGFAGYLKSEDPRKAFDLFARFQVLCAIRQGPYGVSALNHMAEQILKGAGLICPENVHYAGRPVLITRNDYHLKLFNGDVGLILPYPDAGDGLRAFFPMHDGGFRTLHPVRLPPHETVFAMTVHRSQGSEFDDVLLILPDRDSPVLTRELIYTGMTRARKHIEIWGAEDVFKEAVSRRTVRASGLGEALWGS